MLFLYQPDLSVRIYLVLYSLAQEAGSTDSLNPRRRHPQRAGKDLVKPEAVLKGERLVEVSSMWSRQGEAANKGHC